jgi:hypothetical protein
MIEHIQPAMFDQIHSRKIDDLSNLCLIFAMVTLRFAFFTHRFGIVWALQSHGQAVSKNSGATWTKGDLFLLNRVLKIYRSNHLWIYYPIP